MALDFDTLDKEVEGARGKTLDPATFDAWDEELAKAPGKKKGKKTLDEILKEHAEPGPIDKAVSYAGEVGRNIGEAFAPAVTGAAAAVEQAPGLLSRIGTSLGKVFSAKAPEFDPTAGATGSEQKRAPASTTARPTMPTTTLPGIEAEPGALDFTVAAPTPVPPKTAPEVQDMPEGEAARNIAARFGGKAPEPGGPRGPGLYADRQPEPADGLLARALTAVGLRDPVAARERQVARENARANLQAQGIRPLGTEVPGHEIPGQAVAGFTEGATAGLDKALMEAYGYPQPEPETIAGGISRGVGHLAGFIVGAPMKAGKLAAKGFEVAFPKFLAPLIDSPGAAAVARYLGHEATTLGAASGVAATGKALEQKDIAAAAKEYGKAAGQGALLGSVFGAIGGSGLTTVVPEVTLKETASLAARYGLGLAILDAATGRNPLDNRPLAQKAFDYGLDAFFLFKGRGGAQRIQQIMAEAERRGMPPDDLFRELSDEMKAQHIADARLFNPGMFDKAAERYAAKNPDASRQDVEYLVARLLIGEPGSPRPGADTEAAGEPPPPPPPARGVAPVTFVGYDQTKTPAEPMFTVSGDLQMPYGPASRGQLLPGSAIVGAGYGLPDYPKAPKGGGHAPGLVPEPENIEARAKQAEEGEAKVDEVVADAEKASKEAVKEAETDETPPVPFVPETPQEAPTPEGAEGIVGRLETAAERFPTEEELPDWTAQIGEAIAQGEQYASQLPEAHAGLDAALDAAKLIQRVAETDPEGIVEAADVLNRTAALFREADSGVPSPTWMREAKDAVGELKATEADSLEPTKTLVQHYRKALEEAIKGQTPKPAEAPKPAPKAPEKPKTEPQPAPKGAGEGGGTDKPENRPSPPEGESETARQLREKREAAAKRKAEGSVPRPTVSPTPGNQPPPAATERPVVGRPAPTERPAGGVSVTPPPATPGTARPGGGKFGPPVRRQRPDGDVQGLATPTGGSLEDLNAAVQLGGALVDSGVEDPAAWHAEMLQDYPEFEPVFPAIRALADVALADDVYDLNDIKAMIAEGLTAFDRTPEREAWNDAMAPILGEEEGRAYQGPLYDAVRLFREAPEAPETLPEPPEAPGIEDGRPPEEVPPETVPEAPGERGTEPAPSTEGQPPPGPIREPGGGGGEPTGGAGTPGAGGVSGPGGEHGFGDPGQPRVPAVTPARDIILTEEILQLGRGPAQRFRENVEAIQLLKALQAENRQATPEEQRTLARFVGWGGLRGYFNQGRQEQREALIKALSPTEYQAAYESSDVAFYTDPVIAWKVWDLVRRLGFTGGRVLESSAGSGIFLGTQPDAEASKRIAVENEPISAAILKQLYPQAQVNVMGFEAYLAPDNFFDLNIGNFPFSKEGVHDPSDDKRYQRAGLANSLHDFFFAKGLDKVRPGGLLVAITSTGTMDKANANVREWLAQRAELVGAIRLPVGAMSRYGTQVGTDLIVLKKRPAPISLEQAKREPWIALKEIPREEVENTYKIAPDEVIRANAYWRDHPEHLIGKWQLGGQYQTVLATALEDMTTLPAEVDRAMATFPDGAMDPRPINPTTDPTNPETIRFLLPEPGAMPKPGGYAVTDGELWINAGARDEDGNAVLTIVEDYSRAEIETIASILGVRDAAREVLRAQLAGQGDDVMRAAQVELNRVYDAHLIAFAIPEVPAKPATKKKPAVAAIPGRPGYFHNRGQVALISEDPDWGFILSLEKGPNDNGHYDKADIFRKRTIPRLEDVNRADTPQDAMLLSLARLGRLDWPLMISLYPKSPGPSPVGLVTAFTHPADPRMHPQFVPTTAELLQEALGDAIYLNPETGAWETDDAYLSGNVRSKLKAAQAAAKIDGKYQRNVDRLEGVIPDDVTPSGISMDLGEAMIPPPYIAAFANEIFSTRGVTVTFVPALSLWTARWSGSREISNVLAQTQWGTKRVNGLVLLEMTLNNKLALVKDRVSIDPPKYVVNKKETRRARLIQAEMRIKFSGRNAKGEQVETGWIWEDADRAEEMQRAYNDKYNAIVNRTYRAPKTLTFPGLNPGWYELMRQSQKDDVWRILVGGNTLITRIVGSGKTLSMVAAMLEGKRLGTWQKPMMVVPNPIMQQTEASIRAYYPAVNLLVANEGSLGAGRRERFLGQIATGNWDVILVPHSSFGLISVSPLTQQAYIQERIEELMIALINAGGNVSDVDGEEEGAPQRRRGRGERTSPTVREIATQIRRWRKKLQDLLAAQTGKKSEGLHFEELGVDAMFVDEAHYFKNLKLPSRLSGVAGLPSTESARGIDMHMKSRILASRNGERGLVLATGTPVNNSLIETYVMMSYLMPSRLKAMGMYPIDTWLASYARVSTELEFTAQGKFENKARLRRFKNVPELVQLFREVATEQGTAADLGMKVPPMRGDPESDLSEDQVADVAAGAIAGGDPTRHPELGSDNFWLTYPKKVRVRHSVMSVEEVAASQEIVERVEAIQRGGVDPRADNMLKIGTDVRKLTLDGRLYDPTMPENPKGKISVGADVIADILARTAETPRWDHGKGVQRVDEQGNPMVFRGVVVGFMDIATPKANASTTPKKKGERQDWELTPDEFRAKFFPGVTVEPEVLVEAYYSVVLAAVQAGQKIPQRVIDSMSPYPRYHQGVLDAIKLRDNEGADSEERVEAETVEEILARNQAYGALKKKLIERGVPENEIAFIHDAKNQTEKQALIERVNTGEIRVILGSTDKMGVGTNMQRQLVALVDFDAPWRPGDLLQRLGRIDRPGNDSPHIEIYRIIQAGAGPGLSSGDAYQWQVLEGKAAVQTSIMRGKVTVREVDDVGASLEFQAGVAKAVGSGNPLMQDLANLINEQARLQILTRNEQDARDGLRRQMSKIPSIIAKQETIVPGLEADAAAWAAQREGPVAITIDGTEHTGQAAIDAALEARTNAEMDKWEKRLPLGEGAPEPIAIGTYRGFEILVKPFKGANAVMSAQLYTRGPSGKLEQHSGPVTLLSINRELGALPGFAARARGYITELQQEMERMERDLAKPEQYGPRLKEVNVRIADIERTLGINQSTEPEIEDDDSDPTDDDDDLYSPLFVQDLAVPEFDSEQQSAVLHEDYQALTSAAGQAVQHATSQQGGADLTRPDVLIKEMMDFIRQMGLGGISTTSGFQGRKGVHGYRDLMSGNLHIRRVTDLDVAAHEFGHFIQRHLFGDGELRPYRKELKAARRQAFGVDISHGGMAEEEGFAEFVRLWLTDVVSAQQTAPTLSPEFERRLLDERRVPGLDEAMTHFQQQAHSLAKTSVEERLTAMFATGANALDQTVWRAARQGNLQRARAIALDKFTATWGHWVQGLADRQRAYRTFTAAADPTRTLPASEEPDKLASQAPARSVYALKVFLERGILDPIDMTVDTSASYAQMLNLIDPTGSNPDALGRFDVYAILARVLYLEDRHPRMRRPLGTTSAHRNAAKHIRGMVHALEQADWIAGFLPPTAGPDQVAEAVARIDQEYPDFDAALMMLSKVEHGALEYAFRLGHYSEAEKNNILLMNELMVPLWKIMDNTEQGRGKRLSGLQLSAGETTTARVGRLQKLKGDPTQAPLVPPLESSVRNMQAIISAAERNAVAAAIWKVLGRASEEVLERQRKRNAQRAAQGLPPLPLSEPSGEDVSTLGRWATRVEFPKAAVVIKIGQMRRDVVDAFVVSGMTRPQAEAVVALVPPEVWDHTATIFHMASTDESLKQGIVAVYVDGERRALKINDVYLFESMLAVDRAITQAFLEDLNAIVRWTSATARLFRWGTVTHPGFMMANLVRDWMTSSANAPGVLPHAIRGIGTGASEVLGRPSEAAHLFGVGGGEMFPQFPQDQKRLRRFIRQLAYEERTERARLASRWRSAKWLGRVANGLLNLTEMSTRYGMFKAHLKTPRPQDVTARDKSTHATYLARLGTYAWDKMGSLPWVQAWSASVPFMRAGINVTTQFGQQVARNKMRHAWWIFGLLMAKIIAHMLGKGDPRYDEQSATEKVLSITLLWPGSHKTAEEARKLTGPERTAWLNQAYKLPVEQGLALPGTLLMAAWGAYEKGTSSLAAAWTALWKGIGISIMPRPLVLLEEVRTGRNEFFDRPVIPQSMTMQKLPPGEQRFPWTSPIALEVARLGRKAGVVDLSPIWIDEFIQGFFGRAVSGTAQSILPLVLEGAGIMEPGPTKPERATWGHIRTWPGIARFTYYPTWRAQSINDVYEYALSAASAKSGEKNARTKRGDDAAKDFLSDGDYGFWIKGRPSGIALEASKKISALHKQAIKIEADRGKTDSVKKQQETDALLIEAIVVAQTAVAKIRNEKKQWLEKGRQ